MSRSSAPPPVPASNNGLYVAVALLLLGGTGAIVYFKFLKKEAPTLAQVLPPATATPSAPGNENPALYEVPPPQPVAPQPDSGAGAGPGTPSIAPSGTGGCDSPCKGVDTPALANAVRGRVSTARQCYNRALASDPNLKGQVGVSLRIGPSGNVCSAGVTSTTLHSPGVEQCALATLRNASYPPPSGGCKDVGATLVFTPGK
jgi:outer membrane biosynthesis protein TonB